MELDFRKDPTILSMVVDGMADGVFTVDAKGRFVAWSQGAERITGFTQAEIVGKPCEILEGQNCRGFGTLKELLGSPNPPMAGICHQDCKLLSKDGRELFIHGNVRLLADEAGNVQGAVGSFSDLTSFVLANEKITLLEEQTRSRDSFHGMVGKSMPMQEIFRRLRLAAQSDVTVVLTGESGTGKELAAKAIHDVSGRASKPFIGLNCSAIPDTLLESELFGHVKGAFTGAVRDKVGVFQAADHGTLFLDEIGDASPLIQLKLLRAIQEKEIRRVGDDGVIGVDVRLITATNRDLMKLVESGQFREDFYYRIHVFEIALPPLRQRRDDIPLLVNHFLAAHRNRQGGRTLGVAREALQRLMDHPWPGNVRELHNAIEHALVTASGDRITLLDLPPEIRRPATAHSGPSLDGLSEAEQAERTKVQEILERERGSRTRAAAALGVSRVTLWKKLRKLGLQDYLTSGR